MRHNKSIIFKTHVLGSESLVSERSISDEKGVSAGTGGCRSQPRGILKNTSLIKSDTKVPKQSRRTLRSNTSVNYKSRLLEKSLTVNKVNHKEQNNLEYEYKHGRKTAVNSTNSAIQSKNDIQCPNCYNEFPSKSQSIDYRNTRKDHDIKPNNWTHQIKSQSSSIFGSISTLPKSGREGTNESRNAIQIISRPQTPPANRLGETHLNIIHHGNRLKEPLSSKKLRKSTFPQRQKTPSKNVNFHEGKVNHSNLHFESTDVKSQVSLSQSPSMQNYYQKVVKPIVKCIS